MLTEFQRFMLPDVNGKYKIEAEVNWNPDDSLTNESKVVKFTMPKGEEIYVKRENLHEILFAIGKKEDQRKMIPQKLETVHWRRTILGIQATKDIHKGEMMNFPIEISFPCTQVKEIIGELAFKKDVENQQKKDKWANPKIIA